MKEVHQQLGAELFNQSWELLLKTDRSPEDEALPVNTVHASLWHWRQLGPPLNFLRGEWMICHVYNILRLKDGIQPTDWDLAYCYEVLARVMALHGNRGEIERYHALALEAGKDIREVGDRKQFEADLNDEYWFGMKWRL